MDGYKTVPVAVLTRWVPDGARVVEVGAGLGVMTAALAARAALVVSLEPTPRMLAQSAGPHRRRPARGPPPGRGRRCRVPAHDRVDGNGGGVEHRPDRAAV